MNSQKYIAIDIAKDSLQLHSELQSGSFAYEAKGLNKLLQCIRRQSGAIVIFEATGGYERRLMQLLFKNNIPLVRINPARVRAFARSEGLKAKTDPIDAKLLLRFAYEKSPQADRAPSKQQEELAALMDRSGHLTGELAREKTRLQNSPQCIHKSISKMIRFMEKELEAIKQRIRDLVDEQDNMRQQAQCMQSVVGVGEKTAWSILAYLGEITDIGRNQLVALAGIAPYNKDSGKYCGRRHIEGGRAKVRKCLYMAARSAAAHNPHIKEYVDRLMARGKSYKCAIVAAMRKLIIHLQSLLKRQQICLA